MSIVSMIIFIYVGSCWLWINQIDHSTSGLQTWVCKTSTRRHDLKAEAPGHSSTTGLENGRTVDPSEEWQMNLGGSGLKNAIWIGVSEGTHLPLSTTSFNRDQPQLWDHASQFNNSGSNLKIWDAWDCPARPFHQTFATPRAFRRCVINWRSWICGSLNSKNCITRNHL